MDPREKAAPEPIRCLKCGSREFVRVVGGIKVVTPFKFDEGRCLIRLRFDREERRDENDYSYYKRYRCGKCGKELPDEIMDRINDEEYEEVDADGA